MGNSDIKAYWERRAAENRGTPSATTNDIHIRELEIMTVIRVIDQLGMNKTFAGLDVGCGDGRAVIALARKFPQARFEGVDFSPAMIESAGQNLSSLNDRLPANVHFDVADARKLKAQFPKVQFDVVMTDRCLINLTEPSDQELALAEIAAITKPGGYYLAIENFVEGHDNMNRAREAIGLPQIPIRWHNKFFTHDEFLTLIAPHFDLVRSENFASAYYYATRVIYAKLCQDRGEHPDYLHDIHQFAVDLAPHGDFSPIKLQICRRRLS